ncbi:MAG: hypothetical protein ACK4Y4_11560 [Brevundimonas sp.]
MADGFDIHLNEDQARRLKAAAEASGVDPETYAVQALEQAMDDGEEARRWAEYQRTGESVPAEEALEKFRRGLNEKLAAR